MTSESLALVDIDTDFVFSIKLVAWIADASVAALEIDAVFNSARRTTNVGIVIALVNIHAALVIVRRLVSVVALAVEATDSIRALAVRASSFDHRAFVDIDADAVPLGETVITDAIIASLFVNAVRKLWTFSVRIRAFIVINTFVRAWFKSHSGSALAFNVMSGIFNAVTVSTEVWNLVAS